jgi:hypothetical protein
LEILCCVQEGTMGDTNTSICHDAKITDTTCWRESLNPLLQPYLAHTVGSHGVLQDIQDSHSLFGLGQTFSRLK